MTFPDVGKSFDTAVYPRRLKHSSKAPWHCCLKAIVALPFLPVLLQSVSYYFIRTTSMSIFLWYFPYTALSKPVWHIPLLCVQWKAPDVGQRNCLKHVEFYSKNKFESFVRLVGFIIKIYDDARSPERQIPHTCFTFILPDSIFF